MSREFGDYGGNGYFHDKLHYALDDARSGDTNGAKLMVPFLESMYEIAYAVSSHEASDSGEDFVVERCHDQLKKIERAVWGLREFTRAAHELAVSAVAQTLSDVRVEETEKGKAWRVHADHDIPYELGNEVACEIVRIKLRPMTSLYCGSYYSGDGQKFYTVVSHDSRTRLDLVEEENRKLKERIAMLEAIKTPEKTE